MPSWISVLDKSMMESFNKFAPGFMCIGWKPNPFRNEQHTICCREMIIMWRPKIVEDKKKPCELGRKERKEKGVTVGLILWALDFFGDG